MKRFYVAACIAGIALPYSQLLPWLSEHGLAPLLLLQEITRSRISAFAWFDVLVSAVVLLRFAGHEGRKLGMKNLWLPVLATLVVGVSLGLPLFLLLRERQLELRSSRVPATES
jgi:hypothetical protein